MSALSYTPPIPQAVTEIINPVSDTDVYVRCINGPQKGEHVWISRNAHGKQFTHAPKMHSLYSTANVSDHVKSVFYYLKQHVIGNYVNNVRHTRIIYYLHTVNGDPFDDIVTQFSPKNIKKD